MDNSTGGIDLNLDPDMMTTQGSTPQANTPAPVTPTLPTTSGLIDITPGAPEQPAPAPRVMNVEEATLPAPRITDITPRASEPSVPPAPISPVIEPVPQAIPPEEVTALPIMEPVSTPAAPVFNPAPATTTQVVITTSTPATPVTPAAPVTPPPVSDKNTAGLNIDTSSPLYEDPDKVVIVK